MGDSSFCVSFSDIRWYPQATSISAICPINEIGQKGARMKPAVMAVKYDEKGRLFRGPHKWFGYWIELI